MRHPLTTTREKVLGPILGDVTESFPRNAVRSRLAACGETRYRGVTSGVL